MIFSTVRTARKIWRCTCGNVIRSGDKYLEHKTPPNNQDLNNKHWWTFQECVDCATRYGRGEWFGIQ